MPPVGFEPTILAGERTHIYGLDRAATGTGNRNTMYSYLTGGILYKLYTIYIYIYISRFQHCIAAFVAQYVKKTQIDIESMQTDVPVELIQKLRGHYLGNI